MDPSEFFKNVKKRSGLDNQFMDKFGLFPI